MGYTTSTVHGIEVPDSAEANNIPEDIGKVVTALEAGSLVKRLTGAAIAALTAPQKPAGLVVYNTTTGKLQISDGTNFADINGVWQTYTPTLTASTTNPTGWTQTGRYTRIGDTIVASFKLTAGGGMTAGSGVYYVALPATADTTVGTNMALGTAYVVGLSASIWTPAVVLDSSTRVRLCWPANIAGGSPSLLSHNVPWTQAAGYTIAATITYEAA